MQDAGVGEILLTSVDQEGTRKGFDNIFQYVDSISNRPIIVSGGYGIPLHAQNLLNAVQPSALAFASVLHYEIETISNIKGHISRSRKSY